MRWLAALALLAPTVASANGRPPLTNGIALRPGDPHSAYVATTFGFLVSHDDGCSFRWVCEQNIGYGGMFDPKYRVAADGTIFATTFNGLRVSRDGGCTFTTATTDKPLGDPGRIDFWIDGIDLGPTGEVWVATAESGRPNDVYRSTDNGYTFTSCGLQSPNIWWKSVRIAPSNPRRVYAAGYQVSGPASGGGGMQPPMAFLRRTDDSGAHWTASPLAGVTYNATPIVYASAIDPRDPDVVYMTSHGANPPAGDRLYRSTDAGMTFVEVLSTIDAIRDVVIRPSGQVLVATLAGGSFQSTDGATFAPLPTAPQLGCLAGRPDGSLVACGANWQPDNMAVARSADGAAWTKVMRFAELAGPLACPADSPEQRLCAPLWSGLRDQFGATAPACRATGESTSEAPPAKKSGCCDAGEGGSAASMWALVVGALVLRRRSRRSLVR